MLTINQILENNSEENDIFIATYGKEQFDELMRLLEDKEYVWKEGQKPMDDYGNIGGIELGKLFSTQNPYQFADASIVLISLNYTNKTILHIPLLPDIPNTYRYYNFCFDEENSTRLIKPYLLFKKEIKEASDYADS